MSTLTTYHEFVLKRDSYLNDLRALENEVKQSTSRMSAMKIMIGVAFDSPKVMAEFDKLLKQTQAFANANPIRVPVIYENRGGDIGGPQLPTRSGSRAIQNIDDRELSPILRSARNESAVQNITDDVAGAGGGIGGAVGAVGKRGFLGLRGVRSVGILMAARFAKQGLEDVADEISMGWEGHHLHQRDVGDQAKRMREIIEKEHSGVRGGVNWLYGAVGLQPTYSSEIKKLDDAENDAKRADVRIAQVDRRQSEKRALKESTTELERAAGYSGMGTAEKRRSDIADNLRKHDEAAKHIEDAWQVMGGSLKDNMAIAARIRAAGRHVAQIQLLEVARAENAADQTSAMTVRGIGEQANQATLRSMNRGDEAGYAAQRAAIRTRLEKAGIAYSATNDPAERARLGTQYQAQWAASHVEMAAVAREEANDTRIRNRNTREIVADSAARGTEADLRGAGRPREAARLAELHGIDNRVQAAKDAFVDAIGTSREADMKKRLDAEVIEARKQKEAIAAEEHRRVTDSVFAHDTAASRAALQSRSNDLDAQLIIFDAETQHEVKKIEDAEEKKAYLRQRAAERQAAEFRHAQNVANRFQEARDIELRTAGHGGLADEYDIEDETRRNLHEAGGDHAARAAAVALGIAKSRALIKQQSRPQVFGDIQSFASNLQDRILNGDADGLKRASGFLKLLEQNKGRIAGGDKLPGEDDPFASAEQFKQGADKFAGAVDKATGAGNIIGIVRRN